MHMPGSRESGVKTTDGGTKADDKKDGKRGWSGSDHKKPGGSKSGGGSEPEVKPVDILEGRREHYCPEMPPKDGIPARPGLWE